MTLEIQSFAKIVSATLNFDGITVITGKNNTGKSTVGKLLFTMFNAFEHIGTRAENLRMRGVRDVIFRPFQAQGLKAMLPGSMDVINQIAEEVSPEKTRQMLEDIYKERLDKESFERQVASVMERKTLDVKVVQQQLVKNWFDRVFFEQTMPVKNVNGPTKVVLTLKGKKIEVGLVKDALPTCAYEIEPEHKAYFIDTPDILDDVNGPWSWRSNVLGRVLAQAIREGMSRKDDPAESAVEDYFISEKLRRIRERLNEVLKGTLAFDPKAGVKFHEDTLGGNVEIGNMSEGLKAFALLSAALSKRAIQQDDVLILDEPEVHLHPEWELAYAELIVLLRKEFNLTILLTTHSTTFMGAVQAYAQKYGLLNVVNAYRTEVDDQTGLSKIIPVESKSWDESFVDFLSASYQLQDLREAFLGEVEE